MSTPTSPSTPDKTQTLSLIISLLPPHLHSIHSLLALLGTSRSIRNATQAALTPHILFLLLWRTSHSQSASASGSGPGVIYPSTPLHLFNLITPSLPGYLTTSHPNVCRKRRQNVIRALQHGLEGIIHLALTDPTLLNSSTSPLTLSHLACTAAPRMGMMNSLSDLVDKCVGAQWYSHPSFWDGGVVDAATLFSEPLEVLWRVVGYGEAFGSGVIPWLEWLLEIQEGGEDSERCEGTRGEVGDEDADLRWRLPARLGAYDVAMRCEYVKYILPDWHTRLERYMGYQENGARSDYPYPESLLDDGGDADGDMAEEDLSSRAQHDRIHEPGQSANPSTIPDDASVDSSDTYETDIDTQAEVAGVADADADAAAAADDDDDDDDDHRLVSNPLHDGIVLSDTSSPLLDGIVLSDTSSSDDSNDSSDDEPSIPPTVHPLRATKATGPYHPSALPNSLGTGTLYESEHASVLIHLFERSPTWRRVCERARGRAMELAGGRIHRLDGSAGRGNVADASEGHGGDDGNEGDGNGVAGEENGDDGTAVGVFGGRDNWRQVFWEDALWTSGWDGLELIFDEWERDDANDKAKIRRDRRAKELGIELESLKSTIADDHPALVRLVKIYELLCELKAEPKRVEFEKFGGGPRGGKEWTWVGPVLSGDLRAMTFG